MAKKEITVPVKGAMQAKKEQEGKKPTRALTQEAIHANKRRNSAIPPLV